jgi:nucleoside-diphosphate-sugar epimerase
MQDPAQAERCFRVNALGTLDLLQAAESAGVKRFVHLSTGNAYRHSNAPVSEDALLYPSRRAPFYLASKLASEIYVDHWRTARRLSACTLRLASVYGPGMHDTGLIPTLAGRLRSGHKVTLVNGGRFAADMIYIDDVVRCVVAAMHSTAEGPLNVGTGVATSAREVAEALLGIIGRDESLVTYAESDDTDPGFAPLDSSRARALLGLRTTPLREGLSAYLDWLSRR